MGDGATNGSVAGNIVDNAKLKFAEAVDQIFSENISGNGSVTVENDAAATLTFSGNLSYGGITTVNSGVLKFTSGTGNTPLIDIEAGKAVFSTTNVNNPNLNIRTGTNGTFEIADGSHVVGNITGEYADDLDYAGTTQVSGHLTAHLIFQDSLTIDADSTATLALSTSGLQLRVFVNHLNLQSSTSTLDLNNAGMIITNASYTDVVGRIRQALNEANSGWWDGAGITSSVARNDPNGLICLGILTGQELLEDLSMQYFLGKDVTGHSNWILVRPTVLCDSDFSSATNSDDYGFIDCGCQGGGSPAATWMWGDYNYDGVVDSNDYGYIDFAYASAAQYHG